MIGDGIVAAADKAIIVILGMTATTFTIVHVIISLVGIAAGAVVLAELIVGKPMGVANLVFLITTIATSVTGFFFHSTSFGPPHVVGVISLVVLAVALYALYGQARSRLWASLYAALAIFAFYLNAFVGVVQAFQKLPPLRSLAPTQTEPPFLIAQAFLLGSFAILGVLAIRRVWKASVIAR